jgi:hypothetical protein
VNLQAYGISGVLDTLSEAELIGLIPYILERHPKEELVVIGAHGGEPRAWTTWPLAALAQGESCRSLARDWAGAEFDQLYLIGYSTDAGAAAARINQIHTELQTVATAKVEASRNLVVCGRNWGFAAFGGQLDGYEGTGTIAFPDPAQGRLEGLLFRTACRKRYATARLRPLEPELAAKAARIAQRCRTDRAKVPNPLRQAESDEGRYRDALGDPQGLSMKSAVALGIALAADTDLAATAIDHILINGDTRALEVWIEVARFATGTERAASAALAALAAWQAGDDAAVALAEAAIDADPESAFAWSVWHLAGAGIAPSNVRPFLGVDAEAAVA